MLEFLWNVYQQQRIGDLGSEAARSRSKAEQAEWRVRDLEARLESMTLACMTMWSLVQQRVGITDAEFQARMTELDLRDGRLDGRVTPGARTCKACGRTMSPRHARCMYCGSEALETRPFGGG